MCCNGIPMAIYSHVLTMQRCELALLEAMTIDVRHVHARVRSSVITWLGMSFIKFIVLRFLYVLYVLDAKTREGTQRCNRLNSARLSKFTAHLRPRA